MRHVVSLVLLSTGAAFLASCGGGAGISSAGSSNPGYGPFDRNGNYVEAWADKPAKKHRWARDAPAAPIKEEKPAVVAAAKPKPIPVAPTRTTGGTEVASLNRSYQPPAPPTARTYTPPPKPKPKPVAYTPPPKPKPKPVPVKPKAPPPIRHTVVKGDTLYNISRRHNTSVAKIQRANGISGSTIRLGQSLIIPR